MFISLLLHLLVAHLLCSLLNSGMIYSENIYGQELHLHGNDIGDEGVRALMSGLSSYKGICILVVLDITRMFFMLQ